VILDSVPSRAVRGSRLRTAPGAVPPFAALPIGCAFRDRCPQPLHACVAAPAARFVDSVQRDHVVCCHRPLETVQLAP
jgi:peptide/nickel transport system ATP-binding protein